MGAFSTSPLQARRTSPTAAPGWLLYKRPNEKDGSRADGLVRTLAESTAGYADEVHYGIRMFELVNRADKATFARWRFIPQDGEMTRSDPTLASTPGTVLERALIKRTRQGPVRWDMLVMLAEPSDSDGDQPIRWPATREELHLGTMTTRSTMPRKGAGAPGGRRAEQGMPSSAAVIEWG
jgi:hypothetical protein